MSARRRNTSEPLVQAAKLALAGRAEIFEGSDKRMVLLLYRNTLNEKDSTALESEARSFPSSRPGKRNEVLSSIPSMTSSTPMHNCNVIDEVISSEHTGLVLLYMRGGKDGACMCD